MRSGRVQFTRMEEVLYGTPAAAAVAELAQRFDAKRVFIMASGTLNRKTGEVERIRAALGERHAATFDRIPAHTPRASVVEASGHAREAKADLIVSVGGGSATDAAKAVSFCLANDVRDADAIDRLQGADCRAPVVRQVAVPTTLSAGEFSSISGVTNERTQAKELLKHPGMIPAAVVLDPAITVHTPEWLFLSTGVRAVDHCVEGFCANEAHAFSQGQALHGLGLLARGLGRVKADPSDLAARLDCQLGAWLSMGSVSTGVPMGASHGIGYVLGAAFGVPHGHTSCVMLPAVLQWNEPATRERQAQLSAAMGQAGTPASEVLAKLIRALGQPRSLGELGIGKEHFPRIAQEAMKTPWVPRNPRPITSAAQVEEILAIAA
ncbi:iron-containing alcohol dehydrogenase [Ramlibacter sp.]|uniref:iron-containing alcohol dehydrogenase n=1 Tax=Ramlibacter sp. TaxID=1917967 RepID=UPI003D11754B